MWDRKYQTAPDLVVVEGPLAGGHLGFDREKLTELEVDTPHAAETFHQAEYDEEVRGIIALVKKYAQKYGKSIPVVTAGGIYDHADVMHQMELGADGVQVATRFVTTEECDAPMAYKQAYLDAKEEDIVIVKSPVGMPGRAIKNAFLKELEKGLLERCTVQETVATLLKAYEADGLSVFSDASYAAMGLAMPRVQEIYACLNRFRG